jgi:Skp family chaperone for outer membrane proteins
MAISRPLALFLALLIAVAGAAAEEPVAGAVEAAARADEAAAAAAALKAEVERLRAKVSTLGQCRWLDLNSVLISPLFGGRR